MTHELRCPDCAQPGATGDRAELQSLAATHNQLLHRGRPVATVRRRIFGVKR